MEVVHLNHNQMSEEPAPTLGKRAIRNQSKVVVVWLLGNKEPNPSPFSEQNSNVLILRVWIHRETGGSCLLCTVNLDLVPWMLKIIKYWLGSLRLSSID